MFWNKFKFAAAVVLACVATATAADAPNPKEKLGVVREIDLKKFKANWPVGSVYKPTEIRTAEELGKFDFNADKELLAQLVEKVDFTKERLVFMAWSGSGGDALSVTVEEGKKGPLVFFEYAVGKTDDKATHYRLYAVANNASWRVDDVGKRPPAEPAGPNKDDSTAKLLTDLESENPYHRGMAIDLLGERKAKEAIPKLIALVSDGTALIGSDNYIGLHAMQALTKITGQKFGLDETKWQAWWKEQPKEAAQPAVGADSSVKVLSAEATVELRGLLVHTPKGTFVMVREERKVRADETQVEVVAWELDFGKKGAELEQQTKGLSGKAVVVNGTCKMVSTLTYGGNPINPAMPSGSEWRLEKTVTVSRLAASEKK
jgi:hypothetical protein